MTGQELREHRANAVVGYDGSPSSEVAAAWAAREAELHCYRLRIVTVVPNPALEPYAALVVDSLEARARSVGEEGQRLATKHLDAVDIAIEPVIGFPASILIEASHDARLTVVGTGGHGAISALLGSVSFAVTAHAHSTTVVVPEPAESHRLHGPVVVGVDGSRRSAAAVRYASDYAIRHGRPFVALAAWQRPITPELQTAGWGRSDSNWLDSARGEAEEHAHDAVRSARRRHPRLEAEAQVVERSAGPALTAASHTAELVVVGTRGLGGFERLMLGSVSRAVLHRAECPVAVVRA